MRRQRDGLLSVALERRCDTMGNAQFHSPANLAEACALLSQYGARAKILAGGTDLMVAVNRNLMSPEVLVFIGNVGLDDIKAKGDSLILGAAATHTEVCPVNVGETKGPAFGTGLRVDRISSHPQYGHNRREPRQCLTRRGCGCSADGARSGAQTGIFQRRAKRGCGRFLHRTRGNRLGAG